MIKHEDEEKRKKEAAHISTFSCLDVHYPRFRLPIALSFSTLVFLVLTSLLLAPAETKEREIIKILQI